MSSRLSALKLLTKIPLGPTKAQSKSKKRTTIVRSASASVKPVVKRRLIESDARVSQSGIAVLPPLDDGDHPTEVEHFYIRVGYESMLDEFRNWLLDVDMEQLYGLRSSPDYPSSFTKYNYYKVTSVVEVGKPDCLMYAEGLCVKKPRYRGKTSQLKVRHVDVEKGKTRLFGLNYKTNIKLSQMSREQFDDHTNERADPASGNAFAIVRQGESEDEEHTPYHIAYVILEDGEDRITSEVDAGNIDQTRPIFDIYTIDDARYESFHSRFEEDYTIGNTVPITIVLEPVSASFPS
jgi:hypothetical protein